MEYRREQQEANTTLKVTRNWIPIVSLLLYFAMIYELNASRGEMFIRVFLFNETDLLILWYRWLLPAVSGACLFLPMVYSTSLTMSNEVSIVCRLVLCGGFWSGIWNFQLRICLLLVYHREAPYGCNGVQNMFVPQGEIIKGMYVILHNIR